jgi:copper chaperone CopZ
MRARRNDQARKPSPLPKAALCKAIERELMSVLGVDRYETSSRNGRAKIEYDPRQLGPAQIIEILDGALANAEYSDKLDKQELELALCTASIALAAIAQFAMPALLPVAAPVSARVGSVKNNDPSLIEPIAAA